MRIAPARGSLAILSPLLIYAAAGSPAGRCTAQSQVQVRAYFVGKFGCVQQRCRSPIPADAVVARIETLTSSEDGDDYHRSSRVA
ncbi:MAG: hypothetical protein M3300_09150, partial [Actinomycetota bacterium]|nr:hypothetical protein [Actinomycetota bacterium]